MESEKQSNRRTSLFEIPFPRRMQRSQKVKANQFKVKLRVIRSPLFVLWPKGAELGTGARGNGGAGGGCGISRYCITRHSSILRSLPRGSAQGFRASRVIFHDLTSVFLSACLTRAGQVQRRGWRELARGADAGRRRGGGAEGGGALSGDGRLE